MKQSSNRKNTNGEHAQWQYDKKKNPKRPHPVKNTLVSKFPENKKGLWPSITTCNNNSSYLEKQLHPGDTWKPMWAFKRKSHEALWSIYKDTHFPRAEVTWFWKGQKINGADEQMVPAGTSWSLLHSPPRCEQGAQRTARPSQRQGPGSGRPLGHRCTSARASPGSAGSHSPRESRMGPCPSTECWACKKVTRKNVKPVAATSISVRKAKETLTLKKDTFPTYVIIFKWLLTEDYFTFE